MRKKVSGVVRCLNVLESKNGAGMCMFTLAGEDNHQVIVFPACYAAHSEIIQRGAMLEAEGDCYGGDPSARLIALRLSCLGGNVEQTEGVEV